MEFVRAQRSFPPPGRGWLAGIAKLAASVEAPRAAAHELEEARELLAYWEQRARRLPRWALMRRREARAMAQRWRDRVRTAEQVRYGRGLLGAASLLAVEHRLPATVAHRGRQALRLAACTAVTLAVMVALIAAAAVAIVADAVLGVL